MNYSVRIDRQKSLVFGRWWWSVRTSNFDTVESGWAMTRTRAVRKAKRALHKHATTPGPEKHLFIGPVASVTESLASLEG